MKKKPPAEPKDGVKAPPFMKKSGKKKPKK